jgi:hypothetical protein
MLFGRTSDGAMAATGRRIGISCLVALLAVAVTSGFLEIDVSPDAAEASVLAWVVAHTGLLGLVAFEMIFALLAYCVLSGASFFYFFVRRRQCFTFWDRIAGTYKVPQHAS